MKDPTIGIVINSLLIIYLAAIVGWLAIRVRTLEHLMSTDRHCRADWETFETLTDKIHKQGK